MAASYDDPQPSPDPSFQRPPPPSRPHSSSSRKSPDDNDLPSPRTGGCWTCRLRRKKCDEVNRDGSCETCLRLKITCLGWGSKKPDWMRNKEEVELYKAQIKQQLIRSGRIRGQPKARLPAAGPILPVVPTVPAIAGPSSSFPSPSLPDYLTEEGVPIHEHAGDSSSSSASPMMPLTSVPPAPEEVVHTYPTVQRYPANYMPAMTRNVGPDFSSQNPYGASMNESPTYPSHPQHNVWQPSPPSTGSHQEILVFYYFEKVLPYQFPFSDKSLVAAFHEAIVTQPDGPFVHSICALAGLYAARTSQGADFGIDPAMAARCNDFFQWSYLRLAERKQHQSPYTEVDALAAVQLLCYFSLSGASGDWGSLLKIGYEWLENSPIFSHQNPLAVVQTSTELVKFAYRAVLWMDILGSITLRSAPRFARLHQRVLQTGSNYWMAAPTSAPFDSLHMETLMGCPDDVMLALAQTAELNAWKTQQRLTGSLSVQTLVERAKNIEALFRPSPAASSLSRASSVNRGDTQRRGSSGNVLAVGGATAAASSTTSPASSEHMRLFAATPDQSPTNSSNIINEMFRCSAQLLLCTVVSDHFPQVPEIRDAVKGIIGNLERLSFVASERALVFPVFLAGCLTDDPLERRFLSNRLSAQNQHIGAVPQCLKLMEAVWELRMVQGGGVDWHHLMTEQGISILFV